MMMSDQRRAEFSGVDRRERSLHEPHLDYYKPDNASPVWEERELGRVE